MSKTQTQLTLVVSSVKEHFKKMLFAYRNKPDQFEWFDLIRRCCLDARAFDESITTIEACDRLTQLFQQIAIYSSRAYIDCKGGIDEDKIFDQFAEAINSGLQLIESKNHDYDEAWRSLRISTIGDLILSKTLRTESIAKNGFKTIISEGVESNYVDMLNYALFALILIEEAIQTLCNDKESNIQQEIQRENCPL